MRVSYFKPQTSLRRLRFVIVVLGLSVAMVPLWSRAQEAAEHGEPMEPTVAEPVAAQRPAPAANKPPAQPTIWDLTVQGGIFMIPLFIDSIIVLAYAMERHFGLRGKKILPPKLLIAIQQLNPFSALDRFSIGNRLALSP